MKSRRKAADRRGQIIVALEGLVARLRSGEEEAWAEEMNLQTVPDGIDTREDVLACLLLGERHGRRHPTHEHIEVDRAGWETLKEAAQTLGGVPLEAVVDVLGAYMASWRRRDEPGVLVGAAHRMASGARRAWDGSAFAVSVKRTTLHKFIPGPIDIGGEDVDEFDQIAFMIGDPEIMKAAIADARAPRRRRAVASVAQAGGAR